MPTLQPERRTLGPAVSVAHYQATDLLADLAEAAAQATGETVDHNCPNSEGDKYRVIIEGWQTLKSWLIAVSDDELNSAIQNATIRPSYTRADAFADAKVIQDACEDWDRFTQPDNPELIEFVVDLSED